MYGEQPQQHVLVLVMVYPTGAEEWHCPLCGRRLLMQWPPAFGKVVIETGDDSIIHSERHDDETFEQDQAAWEDEIYASLEEETSPMNEDEWLTPWLEWMEKVDFESLWHRDI